MCKYRGFLQFVPNGIKTTGVFGSGLIFHELGIRLKTESGDPRAFHFMLQ